jgi:hypothetical protein
VHRRAEDTCSKSRANSSKKDVMHTAGINKQAAAAAAQDVGADIRRSVHGCNFPSPEIRTAAAVAPSCTRAGTDSSRNRSSLRGLASMHAVNAAACNCAGVQMNHC